MNQKYTPYIVFGTSKSGTTWLQKILDDHPEVSCKFQRPITPIQKEKVNLFYPAISVFNAKRTPFKGLMDQEEEDKYRAELKLLNNIFGNLSKCLNTSDGPVRDSYVEYYRKFIKAVLEVPNKLACGTKSYSDIELFLKLMPEGKIITIVRDPRDVIVSKRFHTLRMGAYFLGDEKSKLLNYLNHSALFRRYVRSRFHKYLPLVNENHFKPLDESGKLNISNEALLKYAHEWVLVNNYIMQVEQQFPDKLIRIKYEDLKQNPEKELFKLFNFLRVKTNLDLLKDILEKTSLQKEKVKGNNSFFRKGISGDWENHLSEQQQHTIGTIVEPLAQKLGYNI